MAHQVIQEEDKVTPPVTEIRERVVTKVVKTIERIPSATTNFVEALTTFIISFWYFLLTPFIIIVRGKDTPKEWLALATKINKERLAKKVTPSVVPVEPEKKPNTYKVVDLDTKKNLKIGV